MNTFLRGAGIVALLLLVGVAWMCQRHFMEERRARQRVAEVEKALAVHLADLSSESPITQLFGRFERIVDPGSGFGRGALHPGLWMLRTLKFERGIPRAHIQIPPDAKEPYRFLLAGNPPSAFDPLPPTSAIIREGNHLFLEYEKDKEYFPAGGRNRTEISLDISVAGR